MFKMNFLEFAYEKIDTRECHQWATAKQSQSKFHKKILPSVSLPIEYISRGVHGSVWNSFLPNP